MEPQLGFLWFLILSLRLSEACGPAEYHTGVECCPMCSPGHCVYKNCTEFTSTTCVPCLPFTFTDTPNGLMSCRPCLRCEAGLRVKRLCTSISDTLCEPLEGHYCTDPVKDGCRRAEEHTKCSPGQYINQTGTASSDTVCGDCGNNTYSDGSFTSCRPPHRQCETWQHLSVKVGTESCDASSSPVFAIILSLGALATLATTTAILLKKRCPHLGPGLPRNYTEDKDQHQLLTL